jgi:hypothetical protein
MSIPSCPKCRSKLVEVREGWARFECETLVSVDNPKDVDQSLECEGVEEVRMLKSRIEVLEDEIDRRAVVIGELKRLTEKLPDAIERKNRAKMEAKEKAVDRAFREIDSETL